MGGGGGGRGDAWEGQEEDEGGRGEGETDRPQEGQMLQTEHGHCHLGSRPHNGRPTVLL